MFVCERHGDVCLCICRCVLVHLLSMAKALPLPFACIMSLCYKPVHTGCSIFCVSAADKTDALVLVALYLVFHVLAFTPTHCVTGTWPLMELSAVRAWEPSGLLCLVFLYSCAEY